MAHKIQYKSVDVQHLSLETVLADFPPGSRLVAGIDVAKRKFLAALCDEQGEARRLVRYEHPTQTLLFLSLLEGVKDAGRTVEVVMEPTGTYGDALRFQLEVRAIPVFRVSNKHVHDAAELFDRSASKHDAKDACVIAWLHVNGRSAQWNPLSTQRRSIRALIAQRELFDKPLRQLLTQMEPLLARHFPELERFFDISRRKTPYRLLAEFGSPAAIAKAGIERVSEVIRKASRRAPDPDKVRDIVQAARTTRGVSTVGDELLLIQLTAAEVLRLFSKRDEVDARIAEAGQEAPVVAAMRPLLGAVTAAVVFAYMGDPSTYANAAAFEKAVGLNLVERSSGTDPGTRHLGKRGPGLVRKYLFLAAMRLVQTDAIAGAWYRNRASFKAGDKAKALIAVERKLCRALVHAAAGKPFDSNQLFDARRLQLEPSLEAA